MLPYITCHAPLSHVKSPLQTLFTNIVRFSQNFQQVISSDAKLPTPHFCYNSTSVSRWQAHFCAVTPGQRMLNAQGLALSVALLQSHQRHSPLFPAHSLGTLTDPAASWGTYLQNSLDLHRVCYCAFIMGFKTSGILSRGHPQLKN